MEKESVLNMTKRLNAVVGINGGGFVDYGVDVIHNRLTSQYLFDSRRQQ